MNEKKRGSRFKLKNILPVVFGALIGAIIGFVALNTSGETSSPEGNSSFVMQMLPVLIVLISFYLGFLVNIVLHESGHLIGGLLSGYQFVSFSVANFMLVNVEGKLKRKKFSIPGIAGQCLMSPPQPFNQSYPFLLYNLGGSLMNFIICGIFIMLFITYRNVFPYSGQVFLPTACVAALFGAINIIPLKIGGVANDGHNIISVRKSEQSRRALWILLTISAQMAQSRRLKDLPDEWFELPEKYDFSDTLSANVALYTLTRHIEHRDFEKAKELAENILNEGQQLIELLKNEARCELLFLKIIRRPDEKQEESIERLFTPELEKYIEACKTQLSKHRLMYAYEKLISGNDEKAKTYLESFRKSFRTHPYEGDRELEQELVELVDQLAIKYDAVE